MIASPLGQLLPRTMAAPSHTSKSFHLPRDRTTSVPWWLVRPSGGKWPGSQGTKRLSPSSLSFHFLIPSLLAPEDVDPCPCQPPENLPGGSPGFCSQGATAPLPVSVERSEGQNRAIRLVHSRSILSHLVQEHLPKGSRTGIFYFFFYPPHLFREGNRLRNTASLNPGQCSLHPVAVPWASDAERRDTSWCPLQAGQIPRWLPEQHPCS